MTTVSVCMITWNEESLLRQALDSAAGLADEVVVVDTGSEDGTVALARELGATVVIGADRMHKAEARNAAQDTATGDWVVVLDADERIADPVGLRVFLEGTTAQAVYIRLSFMDSADQPTLSYPQMRCWRRGTFQYKYRAHEVPVPVDGWGELAHTDFVWEHRPPRDRAWKVQYTLDRLLLDVAENPGDPRPLYYLGRQYSYADDHEKAAETLRAYLDTPGRIDRADAWRHLAVSYGVLGKKVEQIQALFQACAALPGRRDWWVMLAGIYHADGQEEVAAGLLKCALEIPPPEGTYVDHRWHGPHVYDLLARCLWKLERYEEGYEYAREAVRLAPTDARLRENLGWFERKLVPQGEPKRIFITGCAKCGTTLLRRLFYAFKDVEVWPDECHISQFCSQKSDADVLVAKRHRYSLFSEHLAPDSAAMQAELIERHGVRVVNVIRDGRDVIFSDDCNVSPRRWVAAMRQRRDPAYQGLIDFETSYEEIVQRPDEVQERLADALGLETKHFWSEYPDFVPEEEFKIAGDLYRRRALDSASIGKALPYWDVLEDTLTGFEQELANAEYPSRGVEPSVMDEFYTRHGPDVHGGRPRHRVIADLVEGPRVLDVGCGTGDLLLLLQGNGYQLYGIDISQVALEMARERGVDATLYHTGAIPGGGYDTVVISQVLEHLDDDAAMVKVAGEALTPGGLLIVSVPDRDRVPSAEHKREYTAESLRELLGVVGEPQAVGWENEYRILMTVRKA